MFDRSKKKNKQIAMAMLIFIGLAIVLFPLVNFDLYSWGDGGTNVLNFITIVAVIWITLGFHWRKFA